MKIGILTFHFAHNYGAVLQCYALQEVLKQSGHEVRIIDYRQPYIKGIYAIFDWRCFFSLLFHLRLKTLAYYLKHIGRRVKRTCLYQSFRNTYWQETPPCSSRNIPPMDRYIIGSDQVWSLHCTQFMDQVYWGQFNRPPQSRIIGYAISATLDSLSQIGEKEIRRCLPAFSALSFRERKVRDEIFRLTGIRGEVVLDPTLLLPSRCWDKLQGANKQEAVVVYLMDFRFGSGKREEVYARISQLAHALGCGITDLSGNTCSPSDFVSCFKSARYVVTNSFHGVAFALNFEKPLYAIRCHDMLDERYVNLLTMVGGQAMLVEWDFAPVPVPVDYAPIRRSLHTWRQKSLEYLIDNLSAAHGGDS